MWADIKRASPIINLFRIPYIVSYQPLLLRSSKAASERRLRSRRRQRRWTAEISGINIFNTRWPQHKTTHQQNAMGGPILLRLLLLPLLPQSIDRYRYWFSSSSPCVPFIFFWPDLGSSSPCSRLTQWPGRLFNDHFSCCFDFYWTNSPIVPLRHKRTSSMRVSHI